MQSTFISLVLVESIRIEHGRSGDGLLTQTITARDGNGNEVGLQMLFAEECEFSTVPAAVEVEPDVLNSPEN